MILQALDSLYDRLAADESYKLAPPGLSKAEIKFEIVLQPTGELFQIEELKDPTITNVIGNSRSTEASFDACFLWDDTRFLLGWHPSNGKIERNVKCFESFKRLHLEECKALQNLNFQAVCKFLERWNPKDKASTARISLSGPGIGVFRIVGESRYIHEDEEIIKWWMERESKSAPRRGQCLVTGKENVQLADGHPGIHGIRGASFTGARLVSFNCDAFCSYGKEGGFNSPVAETTAEKYAKALTCLLSGPKTKRHKAYVFQTNVLFWTEKPTSIEDVFARIAGDDSSEAEIQDEEIRRKVELFYSALRQGKNPAEVLGDAPSTLFYVLGIDLPSPGRLAVRYFNRSNVGEIGVNLARHFDEIGIVRQFKPGHKIKQPDSEFPPFRLLLDQTCPIKDGHPDRDRTHPLVTGLLVQAVFSGGAYPESLIQAVLRRIHAERDINHPKAAILKGWLVRNHADWLRKHSITMKQALNKDTPHAAYQLGRLFAAYEQTQRAAHEYKLERTIKETMFSAASATPLTVFSRLDRMNKYHLAKLSSGSKKFFNDLFEEIHQKIVSPEFYPPVLDIKQQSLFCIGYYHQMHALKNKD